MNNLKRYLPFLLLNVIISAITTLAVLTFFGGGIRLPAAATEVPTQAAALPPTQAALPTLPQHTPQPLAVGMKVIEVAEVQGAGDLNNEAILLRRVGEGDLRLNGWKMEDNNGHKYTFPDMVLNKDGAIQVFTRSGTNSVIALYWGQPAPVWAVGKTVYVYDPADNLMASLAIK